MTARLPAESLQMLWFGRPREEIELRVLDDGRWTAPEEGEERPGAGGNRCAALGVEVRGTGELWPAMEQLLAEVESEGIESLYLVLPTRDSAFRVSRMLRRASLGPVQIYGVESDYYFGLVPITGMGHRKIELFLLGLRLRATAAARVKAALKRMLIRAGLSARLYESFVVVAEGTVC